MKEQITYTILTALVYYLVLIYVANKIAVSRLANKEEDRELNYKMYYLIALNFNIIIALFLTQDNIMTYFTFMIKDEGSFLTILTSGSVIILINAVVILMSLFLARLLVKLITSQELVYLLPIVWVTVSLLLLKLINLFYETYINTQSYTIF